MRKRKIDWFVNDVKVRENSFFAVRQKSNSKFGFRIYVEIDGEERKHHMDIFAKIL